MAKPDPSYAYRFVVEGEIYEKEAEAYIKADGTVKYEGKLIYEKSIEEYRKTLKDPERGPYAKNMIEYLTQFLPMDEDRFFHGKKEQ